MTWRDHVSSGLARFVPGPDASAGNAATAHRPPARRAGWIWPEKPAGPDGAVSSGEKLKPPRGIRPCWASSPSMSLTSGLPHRLRQPLKCLGKQRLQAREMALGALLVKCVVVGDASHAPCRHSSRWRGRPQLARNASASLRTAQAGSCHRSGAADMDMRLDLRGVLLRTIGCIIGELAAVEAGRSEMRPVCAAAALIARAPPMQ